MKLKIVLALIRLFIAPVLGFSQTLVDSLPRLHEEYNESFIVFTDREIYASGEKIYFSASQNIILTTEKSIGMQKVKKSMSINQIPV